MKNEFLPHQEGLDLHRHLMRLCAIHGFEPVKLQLLIWANELTPFAQKALADAFAASGQERERLSMGFPPEENEY